MDGAKQQAATRDVCLRDAEREAPLEVGGGVDSRGQPSESSTYRVLFLSVHGGNHMFTHNINLKNHQDTSLHQRLSLCSLHMLRERD
jgi:hypothetical protein